MTSNFTQVSNNDDEGGHTMEPLSEFTEDSTASPAASASASAAAAAASDLMPWETSDPFFSAQTRDLLRKVLMCYVRQPIVLVGIPGNILCCAVFLKQGLSERINLLLFWLAVADLSNLVGQLWLMPDCYLEGNRHVVNWDSMVKSKVGSVNWLFTFISGTLIVLVSLDRCLSVALPLRANRMLSYRRTVAALCVAYLLPFSFFVPFFLAFDIGWKTDPLTNHSIAYVTRTSWFPVDSMLTVTFINFFYVIAKIVFLITMVICCSVTIIKLRQASLLRGQMAGNIKEESKSADSRITVMVSFICIAYIVLSLPEICSSMIGTLVPEYYVYRKYHNTVIVNYQFTWLATCLNSAINFFAYVALSSRFKSTLRDLFGCLGYRRQLN